MKLYALDTEVTTYNKGDPFDTRNKFVLGGWYDGVSYSLYNESSFHDGFLSLGSTQKDSFYLMLSLIFIGFAILNAFWIIFQQSGIVS